MTDSRIATKLRKKQAALVHGANRRLLPFVLRGEDSPSVFTAVEAVPREADDTTGGPARSPPMTRPPLPHEGPTPGAVVDVIVLNGGEQSSVDPNALRAAVRQACCPDGVLEVASMTTRGDWAFARIALRVAPCGGAVDLARLLQRLMATTATDDPTTGGPNPDRGGGCASLPRPLQLGVLAQGCTPAVIPALFAPYAPAAALGVAMASERGRAAREVAAAAAPVEEVAGLFVLPRFVSAEAEGTLLEAIGWAPPSTPTTTTTTSSSGVTAATAVPWEALKGGRNVLHFGKRFCYGTNSWSDDVPPLPEMAAAALASLSAAVSAAVATCPGDAAGAGCIFDQCTVNDYPGAGVGIPAHVDDIAHFGPVISVVSLAAAVVMTWARPGAVVPVLLPRGSLAVFTGPARYEWTHAIHERAADVLMFDPAGCSGVTIPREPRVSVTFRQAKRTLSNTSESS